MSRLNWIQRFYWNHLSKPVAERELVRTLLASPLASVLEIGVGSGERMKRISQLVQLPSTATHLRYVGVDGFESANDGRPHLTLKQAHQQASHLGLKAHLIPGDLTTAMPRVAYKIGASDLVIVDGDFDMANPLSGPVGHWLRHITHDQTILFATSQKGGVLTRVALPQENSQRVAA